MNRHQRRLRQALGKPGDPTKADLDRIANAVETTGCERCGTRFGVFIPYVVGRIKTGWVGRCTGCTEDLLPEFSVFAGALVAGGLDPWMEVDRDWFAAHPKRNWCLRWPLPGELETGARDERLAEESGQKVNDMTRAALIERDEGMPIAMVVHQVKPGSRVRVPIGFIGDDPLDSYTDAGIKMLIPTLAKVMQEYDAAKIEELFPGRDIRRVDELAKNLKEAQDC